MHFTTIKEGGFHEKNLFSICMYFVYCYVLYFMCRKFSICF